MDITKAISFKKVNKYYNDFHALKNISFDIPKNSIVGLIGANGSGKTTMIKCLLNYYDDFSGEITVFGEKIKAFFKKTILLLIFQIPPFTMKN